MKFTNSIVIAFTLFFISSFSYAQSAASVSESDKIVGVWEVGSGKARVKISKYGEKYGGRIVWLRDPNYPDGTPKVDKNNPDESKRKVPLLGFSNMVGFVFKGDGSYEEGTIYDPENGSTYFCVVKLKDDNTLDVRGYIGITLFGRTDTWKRVILKK
jgi:uncharacterized protein (DUF2147 family)